VLGILAIISAIAIQLGIPLMVTRFLMYLCLYSSVGKYFRCEFLYSKQLDFELVLPAIAIGLLSVGVLNLNNMRDEASDRKSNKNTIVVKLAE
jgi:1,4-dihydroxy-2-naphthoate octaprenyltransferase